MVGAGWAGRQHAGSVLSIGGAEIVSVFDTDRRTGAVLAADLACFQAMSLEELFCQDLDAVVVSTPSGAHRACVVGALEQGIAVFVEKPLARHSDDAWAIARAVERSDAVCAVGYQWRALDFMAPVKQPFGDAQVALIVSQGIGVTQARSWFHDDTLSGGLIFERVSHHIDLHRFIGGEVASVSSVRGGVALSGRRDPSKTRDDVLSLTMQFINGAVGLIAVGWTPEAYPPTQSLTVNTKNEAFDLALDPDFILVDRSGVQTPLKVSEHPFQHQMTCFLQAVCQNDQSLIRCSAGDAAGTVDVALAAAASLEGSSIPFPVPPHA